MVQGLKCLVGKTGNKRFLFRYTYNRRKHSISLGKFGDINVTTARELATKHRVNLNTGHNPRTERDSHQHLTVDEFFQQHYLPSIRKRKKSWRDDIGRKELADWLTFYGYDTSNYDVRNGSRGRLVFEIVPVTDKSLKLLRLLLLAFPHFEFEPLFDQTKIPELYQRLYSM